MLKVKMPSDKMRPKSIVQYKNLVTLLVMTMAHLSTSAKDPREITGVEILDWKGNQPDIELLWKDKPS